MRIKLSLLACSVMHLCRKATSLHPYLGPIARSVTWQAEQVPAVVAPRALQPRKCRQQLLHAMRYASAVFEPHMRLLSWVLKSASSCV